MNGLACATEAPRVWPNSGYIAPEQPETPVFPMISIRSRSPSSAPTPELKSPLSSNAIRTARTSSPAVTRLGIGGTSLACTLTSYNSRHLGPAVRVYIAARPLERNSQPTHSCASRLPPERTVHASAANSPSQSQSSRRAGSVPSHNVAFELPSWRSQR